MNVRHILAASLISLLVIPGTCLAQSQPPQATVHQTIEREAIRLANASAVASGQPAPIEKRNWAARHPIALGAILGVATGAAIAQATSGGRLTDSDGRPVMLLGGVPGFVIGASIGAAVAFSRR